MTRSSCSISFTFFSTGRGWTAFRPWVQAIGHLEDEDLEPLLAALRADGLLDRGPSRRAARAQAVAGAQLQGARTRPSALARYRCRPPRSSSPPRAPLPYQRRLPIRGLTVEDRSHPKDDRDGWDPRGVARLRPGWPGPARRSCGRRSNAGRRGRVDLPPPLQPLRVWSISRPSPVTTNPPMATRPPRPTTARVASPGVALMARAAPTRIGDRAR